MTIRIPSGQTQAYPIKQRLELENAQQPIEPTRAREFPPAKNEMDRLPGTEHCQLPVIKRIDQAADNINRVSREMSLFDSNGYSVLRNSHKGSFLTQIKERLNNDAYDLDGLRYIFLRMVFPEEGFSRYCPDPKLERLLEMCQEIGLEYPERFDNAAQLEQVVSLLYPEPRINPEQPVAVLLYNRHDPNGAFQQNNQIAELLAQGYQVCYSEAERDTDLAALFSKIGQQRKIDLVVLAGHGRQEATTLTGTLEDIHYRNISEITGSKIKTVLAQHPEIGEKGYVNYHSLKGFTLDAAGLSSLPQDEVFSFLAELAEKDEIFADLERKYLEYIETIIDFTDREKLAELNQYLAEDAILVLESCSTGKGGEVERNMANFLAGCLPGHTVFAPTRDTFAREYNYNPETKKVTGVVYDGGPETTYKARQEKTL
jgi:hypothetical protein